MDYESFIEALLVSDNFRLGIWDFILATIIPFALTSAIATVWKTTEARKQVQPRWMTSLFLSSMLSSLLMVILGSDVARAIVFFGLLLFFGRGLNLPFSRKVYLLWAIVTGTACGVKYYIAAAVFTFLVAFLILILSLWRSKSQTTHTV